MYSFSVQLSLFFILGCACSWVGHKYKTKQSGKNTYFQTAPLYEDLQPSMPTSLLGDQESVTFEIKENIVYGPII